MWICSDIQVYLSILGESLVVFIPSRLSLPADCCVAIFKLAFNLKLMLSEWATMCVIEIVQSLRWRHDGPMASPITSLTLVYSTVYSGADQRKHQSSASLAFVQGIHRWPVNTPNKRPVTRKMFPFDGIMASVNTVKRLWRVVVQCSISITRTNHDANTTQIRVNRPINLSMGWNR